MSDAKAIEGGAKASFATRMGATFANMFKPKAPVYSVLYGAAAGVVLSGLVYVGRTIHVTLFDHEYYKIQSRKRYYEKQLCYQMEQDEAAKAHYLASLAAEYNPVAMRMPFKPLDPKYRF
jgi:hypothetical protein